MKSYQGHFLIAAPELLDPNFRRAVVLIVKHDDEGTFGLVLNRPTSIKLAEVWQQVSEQPCPSDVALHLGGPCQGPLMAVHAHLASSEIEVLPGLHFCASADALLSLVAAGIEPVRFFVGYAGWGPGQLEDELDAGGWLTRAATSELVFLEPGRDLWTELTRAIGSNLIDALGIKHVPPDPRHN